MIVLVPESALDDLRPLAATLPVQLVPYAETGPLPGAALAEAEAVFRWIAGKRYAEIVARGPKVRWLHTASAGLDHVITPEVHAKPGLVLTDSGPAFAVSLPEFVLAWMLAETHRIPEMLAQREARRWEWVVHGELAGQTAGIIGLGPIGQGVAARCRALGMRTLGYRRRPEPCAAVDETLCGADGLTRLLTEADWVVLAAALTPQTRGLLGAAELARMKPTARLVNIARGPIVDEAALIEALRAGRIAGAVLDVFDSEPLPPESPFWDLPAARITFHSSGWTEGLRRRQRELFVDNLARFVRGEALAGVANIGRGY